MFSDVGRDVHQKTCILGWKKGYVDLGNGADDDSLPMAKDASCIYGR
jgi:hypothetical protein